LPFVGNGPSRHVFADDVDVGTLNDDVLTVDGERQLSLRFEGGDVLLRELSDGGGHGFHQFAILLSHHAEVTLHRLLQHIGLDKLNLLDVDFVEDERCHGVDVVAQLLVGGGDAYLLQRLAHDDAFLLAE